MGAGEIDSDWRPLGSLLREQGAVKENEVEKALAHDFPCDREARQNAVRNCTWDVRAREVAELFRGLLDGQESRGSRVG